MWFIFGDSVLDRLLSTDRARSIDVYFEQPAERPARENLERLFGDVSSRSVQFTNVLPPIAAEFQRYVISSDGSYFDRLTEETLDEIKNPPPIRLLNLEASISDILHCWFTHVLYPELRVEPLLLKKLEADVEYFQSLEVESPHISHLLMLEKLRVTDGSTEIV